MSRRVVLVTGASGTLGRPVCSALVTRDWTVRALVHRTAVALADEHVRGSLEDASSLTRAVEGAHTVLHLAALTHSRNPRRYDQINRVGTVNLVDAARTAGASRFVLASTRAISPEGGAYSRSKNAAETAVAASGLDYTIVRLPELYGAGGSEGVDRIIGLARAGKAIPLVAADTEVICPAHFDDVVPSLVEALENERAVGKTYTLAGDCLTLRAFAESCVTAFESASSIVDLPLTAVRLVATLGRFLPLPVYPDQVARLLAPKPRISEDAVDHLRFRPRSLEEGLRSLARPTA